MSMNLEAMENIRQQKARYCRLLDTKQFDAWVQVFKPDAEIIFYNLDGSVMAAFSSIGELAPLTRQMFSTTQTIHQTHNSEIEFHSASRATAIWSMEDRHIYAAEAGNAPKTLHGYGFYHEEWELVDGTWKIAKLELRRSILMMG